MREFDDATFIHILSLIGSLSLIAWLITFVAPISAFPVIVMLLAISASSYSLLRLTHISASRTILITVGIVIFFALRFIGLRDIWYLGLLIALLVALDRIIVRRK